MDLKMCEKGHYYDGDKYTVCPHCARLGETSESQPEVLKHPSEQERVKENIREKQKNLKSAQPHNKTVAFFSAKSIEHKKNSNISEEIEFMEKSDETATSIERKVVDENRTVSKYQKSDEELPVGWLLCVHGEEFGKVYALKVGKNTIGRSVEMDIVIHGDANVSRENHGVILFEPEERKFIISPAECRNLVYLNGKVLTEVQYLKKNDILKLGETKILMIPFCDEEFSWELFQDGQGPETIISQHKVIEEKQMPSIWECPLCKTVNQGTTQFCIMCGYKVY